MLVALAILEMIVSRTIFHFPYSALDRINVIAMIWACFLVAGLLVETDGHVAVTFLPAKLTGLRLSFLKALYPPGPAGHLPYCRLLPPAILVDG